MGISSQVIKALIHENEFKPIVGEFLSFGRQTVNISQKKLKELCFSVLSEEQIKTLEMDEVTRHSEGKRVSDKSLIEALFRVNYQAVDKSDYEKPSFVLDLTTPIPTDLLGRYDFIFSGGTLDNVFNPAQLIINASKLLKDGGRILHFEAASSILGAYSFVTPEWFYSYYAVNNFADIKVYLCHQPDAGFDRFDYQLDIFNYKPSFTRVENFDHYKASLTHPGIQYLICLAEKGNSSSEDLIPHQLQYLDKNTVNWPVNEKKYNQAPRPLMSTNQKKKFVTLPYLSDHFTYLGSGF